ncbi:hypothetical protein [Candidatus Palauibacter sp.]|uniref:hypothetical protein n=1 Tax=Candidatus Palauibacter sp. TaxID=3101350 RepID=UPI003B017055
MSVFIFIIVIVGLITFGEVASKWFEARPSRPEVEPAGDEEVERLREQVALLAGQVERLTEEQRFMTRLLESGARGNPPPSDEHR